MCIEVEQYFRVEFQAEWWKVWLEGRAAQENGVSRCNNPHKLKVWQAVWEYGWDGKYL